MRVYKYFHRKYSAAVQMGFYRLNTFENIRSYDIGNMIGDATEAIARNTSGNLHIDNIHDPKYTKFIKDLSPYIVNTCQSDTSMTASMTVIGATMTNSLADAYMFCATASRNDVYWANSENYDACIEIKDFHDFSYRISQAFQVQEIAIYGYRTASCFFEENKGVISEGTTKEPDYFRKPHTHEIQKEVRTVFIPVKTTKLPPISLYVDVKDLVTFL